MRPTPFLGRTLCATSTPVRTLCAAFVLATACLLPAFAQPYPARPVSFILPVPPGGALDILARALGQQFALRNGGAQILIDNRPGADFLIATEACSRAKIGRAHV